MCNHSIGTFPKIENHNPHYAKGMSTLHSSIVKGKILLKIILLFRFNI